MEGEQREKRFFPSSSGVPDARVCVNQEDGEIVEGARIRLSISIAIFLLG
jgi:hypothetical protein